MMGIKEIILKLGIALIFVVVGIILTGELVLPWLLGMLIFYLEIRNKNR